ncbi:SPOR domain-containing protein [Pedobacter nyackensis]|uniref:HU domain-containing protein n=1 Tax=Pedobacter nyackensis TaxID=475255 RepID=UPI00292DC8C8|nr:SPOR domain-containing protein [Pedobacter nyackensis]
MDILSYLTTLIKTHKEVGIPGLGTIYKRKSPGRYDTNTHSFLPPSYTLGFTSDLKEHTLLTELISKKKNITVDSATYFVEQFSQNILDELSGHQESDFGDLGTFSTTTGSLTFIPKQDSNLGFDFYGLPTLKTEPNTDKIEIFEDQPSVENGQNEIEQVEVAPIEIVGPDIVQPQVTEEQLELENNNADLRDGTEKEIEEVINVPAENDVLISHLDSTELPVAEQETQNDEQPVYEEIAEATAPVEIQHNQPVPVIETPENITEASEPVENIEKTAETVHFTLDYSDQEKTGMPAYLKVIIALAAIILLAGIAYLAKPELFDSFIKKSADQPLTVPDTTTIVKDIEQIKIDSIALADSIRKSNERAILAADSAKDSIAVKKAIPVASTSDVTYEIIAASLLNQTEADNFLADMKKKGIPAKVADMPGRRVKISIGSFTDEETAKKELEVLKKTTKIPGIYIYKVRHTNNPK